MILIFLASCLILPLNAQPPALSTPPPATPLALVSVTVIDGLGGPLRPGQTILLENGRIADMFDDGSKAIPDKFEKLPLSGLYVIPGLIDSHVHMGQRGIFTDTALPRKEFRRWLYSGVTSVREMGGDAHLLAVENRLIYLNRMPGPDIYYSATLGGRDFVENDPRQPLNSIGTGKENTAWFQQVTDETNPVEAISRARGANVTGIKFYIGVEADLIRKITDEAHRQGLQAWGHLTVFPDRPLEVVNAGIDVVSHMWGAAWQDNQISPAVRVPYTHTSPAEARSAIVPPDPTIIQAESPEMRSLFNAMVENDVLWDLTYSVTQQKKDPYAELSKKLAIAAAESGVRFCTGTDYYNDIDEPFPALYQELFALVRDGILTPSQAITASTLHGAEAIGIKATHGTVEKGKVANLVVLRNDPLENIEAIKDIEFVLKDGRRYYRSEF